MTDLRDRFLELDQLGVPELWLEAERRVRSGSTLPEGAITHPSRPRRGRQLVTIAVAFAVFAAAGVFAWRALAPSRQPAGGNGGRDLGLDIRVPHDWHLLQFANPTTGVQISNVVLPTPVAGPGAPVQASGETLPRDGVALVVYEGTWRHVRLTTLPLSISDFAEGSASAGAPTLDVASFTGNGRTYVVTLKIGPSASAAAIRSAGDAIATILWSGSSTPTLHRTLILDPPINSETFAPPNGVPALTAKQALTRFESVDRAFKLVPDSTIWLGTYTAAKGPSYYETHTYRFRDRLAYGIRYHACTLPSEHPFESVTPSPSVISCTRWLFLDANTGKMLEDLAQLQR